MKITRKINILVATRQKVVIRQPPLSEQKICEKCGGQMTTAQTAAILSGIGIREIYRLIEKQTLHFAETYADITHICLSSISRFQK